jgi:hypothetical protein
VPATAQPGYNNTNNGANNGANCLDTTTLGITGPMQQMDAVIQQVQLVNCWDAQGCAAHLLVTAAPAPVSISTARGTAVAATNVMDIYVPSGASVTLGNGTSVPVTQLQAGDEVRMDYAATGYAPGHVATNLRWYARLGEGWGY